MSYTTRKNKEGKWEVGFAGKPIFVTELEDVADDLAIALAAARHERLKRKQIVLQ